MYVLVLPCFLPYAAPSNRASSLFKHENTVENANSPLGKCGHTPHSDSVVGLFREAAPVPRNLLSGGIQIRLPEAYEDPTSDGSPRHNANHRTR